MRKLHTLEDFLKGKKSLRQAASALDIAPQSLSWMRNKVDNNTFILEDEDGSLTVLREVRLKKKGA